MKSHQLEMFLLDASVAHKHPYRHLKQLLDFNRMGKMLSFNESLSTLKVLVRRGCYGV